jgi:hypothetical protein
MEEKKSRKYNSEFRKNLKNKISKLSNKNDFIQIYKIVNSESENKLSINRNGIYFNLNLLSDKIIEEISLIIDKSDCDTQTCSEHTKIIYETYNKDTNIENFINGHKLTNQEKSFIKKFRQTS